MKLLIPSKIYANVDKLPTGQADASITPGALVLEGGGWKGLYTLGVLDAMMQENINFSSVVGVSAGTLSALGYVAGQIGWGARVDLLYRHDRNYVGVGALRRDHGITGFSYLFEDMEKMDELYWLGYHDMREKMDGLKGYLSTASASQG